MMKREGIAKNENMKKGGRVLSPEGVTMVNAILSNENLENFTLSMNLYYSIEITGIRLSNEKELLEKINRNLLSNPALYITDHKDD